MRVEAARVDFSSFNLVQICPKEVAGEGVWVRAGEGEGSRAN